MPITPTQSTPPNVADAFSKILGTPISTSGNANPSRAAQIRALGASSAQPDAQASAPGPSLYDKYSAGVNKVATDIFNPIKEAGTKVAATVASDKSPLRKVADITGDMGGAVADSIFAPVGDAIGAIANKAGNSKTLQDIATSHTADAVAQKGAQIEQKISDFWDKFSAGHPDAAAYLKDSGNVGKFMTLFAGDSPEVKDTIKGMVDDTTGTVKSGVDNIKAGVNSAKDAAGKSMDALDAKNKTDMLKKVADDWEKPAKTGNTSFNKARGALDQSPESPKFLADHKLNPSEHIDENGKYDTADTADALRETAGKMSHDTLRPSLQMADYMTPKTAVSDVVDAAVKEAGKTDGVTASNRESVIDGIRQEGLALERRYPEGMSLTDMHDNKIDYSNPKNSGYSPTNDPKTNINATMNRSVATALQKTVEAKAPADVPVHDFNQHLSGYYKAADYLDTLNGKKAPVSLGQKFARSAAKVTGGIIGGHFGGIAEEFAGYQIGKALEYALENISNPMRASFLRNLETTNPEAFTKVQNYLKTMSEGNTGIPRLKAPDFIAPPAPSEAAQMESRARVLLNKK